MNNTINNTGELFNNESSQPIASASTSANVINQSGITMTKTVDRGSGYYMSGDPITFTITITNNNSLPVMNLVFRDEINNRIIPSGSSGFNVTTTSGTITSENNLVIINNISIGANSSVIITISGIVA